MSLAKAFIYVVTFTIYILSATCDSDLQCYVCTDCEFNYEGTATTCEDIRQNTVLPLESITTTGGKYTTANEIMITDEITSTTDASTSVETACTEIPDSTTYITGLTTDDPLSSKPTTSNAPIKLTTKTIKTSSIPLSTKSTNPEYTSTEPYLETTITETTTEFSSREVSPTISILFSTTEASDTTTLGQITSQTEGQESTVLPVITSTSEVERFISTTESSVATSDNTTIKGTSQPEEKESTAPPLPSITPSVTEVISSTTEPAVTNSERSNSENDRPIQIAGYPQSPSGTETPIEATTNIASTFSTVLGSTTDFTVTLHTTNIDTSTEASLESKGSVTSTLPTTLDGSSIKISSTWSTSGISSTTEELATEFTTNSDTGSTMMQNYSDEPNVMMIDETKKYGPRYRLIRAVIAKQDSGPRCIVTSYQEQNRTIVMRGCSFGEVDQDCNSVLDGKVKINNSKCFVCNTNLCNSASNSIVSVFILLTTISIVSSM